LQSLHGHTSDYPVIFGVSVASVPPPQGTEVCCILLGTWPHTFPRDWSCSTRKCNINLSLR
jgi:hypothetical protein